MQELQPTRYTSVLPLFQGITHNIPVVHAVLEGNSPGLVFADSPERPTCALVCTQVGFHFVAGRTDNPAFNAALARIVLDQVPARIGESEVVLFGLTPGWFETARDLLRDRKTMTVPRLVFRFIPERFAALGDWRTRLPQELRMVEVDAPLARHMGLGQPFFASADDFVRLGLGMVLMDGDKIACTCTSVFVGAGQVEIDIATDEAYRRRGLATLTAWAFIERALQRGLTPAWSCWPGRVGSARLAEKLGFERLADAPCIYRERMAP